jgi:hypothetical protein
VVTAKAKGKIKGEGELTLQLTSVTVKGQSYTIQTAVLENTVKGKGKRTAVTTGGGAAGGALIGGIAGGGKGAGIGALVGAGAGLLGGAMTGNQQIEIPAESALSFPNVRAFDSSAAGPVSGFPRASGLISHGELSLRCRPRCDFVCLGSSFLVTCAILGSRFETNA